MGTNTTKGILARNPMLPTIGVPVARQLDPAYQAAMPQVKSSHGLGDLKKYGLAALGGIADAIPDEQPQQQPYQMLPVEALQHRSYYYMNPYQTNPYQVAAAKYGGTFRPGDQVMVGDGSGPELLQVQKDGVRVIPNPADDPSLPQLGPPVAEEPINVVDGVPQANPAYQIAMPTGASAGAVPAQNALPVIADVTPPAAQPAQQLPTIESAPTQPQAPPQALPTIGDPADAELAVKTKEYVDAGKYRDRHWSKWDKLAAFTQGFMSGGVLGGINAARDHHYFEDQRIAGDQARLLPQIGALQKIRDTNAGVKVKLAQADNYQEDNAREKQRVANTALHQKRADLIRAMNYVQKFDPTDPDNADTVAALKDAGLPVLPKSAKTSFKYITDARSGQVFVDQSDTTGERKLLKLQNDDGSDFKVTTPQLMTSEDKQAQRDLMDRLAKERGVNSIRVAEIGAGSREKVAGINQEGATQRTMVKSADEAAKVLAAIDAGPPLKHETPEQTAARKQAARDKFLADHANLIPK